MEEQNKITTNSVENKPEMVEQLEAMDLNHPSEESNSANPSETIEMATQPESQPETEPTELVETEATVEGPTEEEKESVESDESHSQELPDFHEMSTDELLLLAEKVLTEKAISELKPYFEGMKAVLEPRFDADYKQAEEQFLEAGGNSIDFRFHNPKRDAWRSVLQQYRENRRAFYKHLEKDLNQNLAAKRSLIEELRMLIDNGENMGSAYQEFKNIQERFRSIGPIPKEQSDDVWQSFHHQCERFYDLLKINRELRELDFKKNLEAKLELVSKVEALLAKSSLKEALSELDKLHLAWKRIGPVEDAQKEEIWQKFSAVTKAIHERRNEYLQEQVAKNEARIQQKRELLIQLQQFATEGLKSTPDWQKAGAEFEAIFENFKKLGRINHPDNDLVWEEAKQALKQFQHHRNEFYKHIKAEFKENLDRKKALLEKALELKDSDDWKGTADKLKRLQADWKKSGPVGKREGDKLWFAFREACNHFFDRLKSKNNEANQALIQNLEAKQALVKAFEEQLNSGEKPDKKALNAFMKAYRQIGYVPQDERGIDQTFDDLVKKGFDMLKIDRQEASRMQFESRLEELGHDDTALDREKQFLLKQLEEAKKELLQLENNIQFFKFSKPNNPMLAEINRNIEHQQERIVELKNRMKLLKQTAAEKS